MNTQQPPFTPIQYIPAKEKDSVLNLPITSLAAVAHEPPPRRQPLEHLLLHYRNRLCPLRQDTFLYRPGYG